MPPFADRWEDRFEGRFELGSGGSGGGGGAPEHEPSLDFSDDRNGQYLALIFEDI